MPASGAQNPFGLLPSANALFGHPGMGYFPGQTVAGPNALQGQGWQSLINAGNQMAGHVPGIMGGAGNAMNQFSSWLQGGGPQIGDQYMQWMSPGEINQIQGNFEVNPYVQDVSDAFGQQAQQQFQRLVPKINQQAALSGGMGGSRHALAQGLAQSDMNQQLQNSLSTLHQGAWRDAMQGSLQSRGQTLSALGADRSRATNAALANAQNQISAYGLMPGMMTGMGSLATQMGGLAQMPGQAMLGAGNFYQGNAQNQLNSAMDRWNWTRENPWNRLGQLGSIMSGSGMGQFGSGTQTNPNQGSALGTIAGLGLTLAGMPSSSVGGSWLTSLFG